jgi:hypothetical protein
MRKKKTQKNNFPSPQAGSSFDVQRSLEIFNLKLLLPYFLPAHHRQSAQAEQ